MNARLQVRNASRCWRSLAGVLALLAAAPAVSQPAGSYEVELIIFRRSPEARNSVEDSALPATAWPRGAAIIGAGDPWAAQPAAPEPRPADDNPALSGEAEPEETVELALGSVWRRLERLATYEPLLHVAWLAAAPPRSQAPAHAVEAGTAPGPELLGQARLFRQRSLFLDLELDLLDVLPPPAAATASGTDQSGQALTGELAEVAPAPGQTGLGSGLGVFRLRETRKMRPGEIHYFDHPAFGAIATIRSREPEAEPEDGQAEPGVPP